MIISFLMRKWSKWSFHTLWVGMKNNATTLLVSLACSLKIHILLLLWFSQSLSRVWLFVIPWTAACQSPLSFTISQSLLRFMSIESVMLSNQLILCCLLLHLPLIFTRNQGLFQWVSPSHQVAKVLELQLQHQSFQWIFRVDFL